MAAGESQESTLHEDAYNDPSQLSQLLRQRAGSDDHSLHFTTSTENQPSVAAEATFTVPQPPSRNALLQAPALHWPRDQIPRRAQAGDRYVKPALSKHHTAPIEGVVMEREGAEKLHQSFADLMDFGDTQADSQLWKGVPSFVHTNSTTTNGAFMPTSLLSDVQEEAGHNSHTDGTDDIEIVGSSQQQHSPAITSPTVIQDDGPETQIRSEMPLTSPLKFETPAMAGRKRDNQGQILSSAMRTATTPGTTLTAAFGAGFGNGAVGNAHGMSLTQIFQATPAGTSPALGALNEDLVFQRPSPNIDYARHSSPIPVLSSPSKAVRIEAPMRSSSEPRAEYVTMKQSQEQRRRERQRQLQLDRQDTTATGATDDSWDVLAEAERIAAKQSAKARFEKETGKSFAKVSAPVRSPARRGGRRGLLSAPLASPGRKTPSKRRVSKQPASDGVIRWDGAGEDEDSMDELPHTTPAKPVVDSDSESPDELSQGIPFTKTPRAAAVRSRFDRDIENVLVPNTSSHPRRTLSGQTRRNTRSQSPTSQIQRESQLPISSSQPVRRPNRLKSSRETVAVMDSQPDPAAAFDSIPRPRSLLPSSPSSNQYSISQTTMLRKTGLTSQAVPSSIPPLPPRSSSQGLDVLEEEIAPGADGGVPSSPPLIYHEDELEYDEHSGGEEGHEMDLDREQSEAADVDSEPHGPVPSVHDSDAREKETKIAEPNTGEVDPEGSETSGLNGVRTDEPHDADALHSEDDELVVSSQHPEGSAASPLHTHLDVQRESTVPESEILEDTQPSVFGRNDVTASDVIHPGSAESAIESRSSIENNTNTNAAFESGAPIDNNTKSNAVIESSVLIEDNTNSNGNHESGAPIENNTNSAAIFHTAREVHIDESPLKPATSSSKFTTPTKQRNDFSSQQAAPIRSLHDIANLSNTQRSTSIDKLELPILSFPEEGDISIDRMVRESSADAQPAAKRRKVHVYSTRNMASPLSKSNAAAESIPTSSRQHAHKAREDSLSSSQEREQQGALAASNARDDVVFTTTATLKSDIKPQSSKAQTSKKGALSKVNKSLLGSKPVSPKTKAPVKPMRSKPSRKSSAKAKTPALEPDESDVDMADAAASEESDELAGPTPQPVVAASDTGEEPSGSVLVHNRIFAFWPGGGFYPATCIGRAGPSRLNVRFDDGNTHEEEAVNVRAFDLKTGDHVKVDHQGFKTQTYVVIGFKDKINIDTIDDDDDEFPLTDRLGYKTIVLEPKARDSLPKRAVTKPQEPIEAPISSVYLTAQLWPRYRDRHYAFTPTASPSAIASRFGTPATGTAPGPSKLKEAVHGGSIPLSASARSRGIFANMAFAITLTSVATDKHDIARIITKNGGLVVQEGFHELFVGVESPEDVTSPKKGKGKATSANSSGNELTLKPEYKDLGFVALITDSHSRRSKYMEALALNIPCLHYRWLIDCITAGTQISFGWYLLAAGESSYLGPNVIRSRTLDLYSPTSDKSFEQILEQRQLLFKNQSALIITGKSKKEIERKEAYVFLAHSLGSTAVARATDLAVSKQMIIDEDWDWVYVDGGSKGVTRAAHALFDDDGDRRKSKGGAQSRKRKRGDSETLDGDKLLRAGNVEGKTVHVACDEFVVQSLILGALVEE
ncbi:hypothetical protein BDV96DRAFT_601296 [Lophiotrema nucula]|uniref:BRCT domain-containing protein n=1 Tax=Lophiotrema nucula TaxID=690887 RepID=A0A6A5Z676_9PLEO|nr:hypothetical protein BDV96DRAFT_601296 [Lophiotrema nucula]